MRLTAQVKLQPTPEQANALQRTLERANDACNYISRVAWEARTFRQFAVHTLVYKPVRETFELAAQVVVRCIAKVADSYKLDTKVMRSFTSHGAIAYDDRILSFALPKSQVSLWTVDGRQSIPFVCGERQRQLLASQRGETDLALVNGEWYLFAVCEVETPGPCEVEGVLGVDLGIVTLATDSDGEAHSGEQVERKREWYARRRAALQAVGTKSAKRRLRHLSGRQRRFQKDTNHRISKQVVAKAERTKRAIAVEELTGIRQRVRARGPAQRARHSNWAFAQLRQFLSYKAQRAGVAVLGVDPRNTSRTCSACGHCEKANRRSQAAFCCVVCGHQAPADVNAALNIRNRADCQTAYGVQPSG